MAKIGKKHITVQSGTLEFVKLNAKRMELRDVYHWLIMLSWFEFTVLVLVTYFIVTLTFTGLFLAYPGSISSMDNPPTDAFFFSVETMATVGYGHMYPGNFYGHCVATVAIVSGMFGMALITGLIFVRFSRPVARIGFSKVIVYHPFDGKPTLTFRAANLRHHPMAEAQFRLMLIKDEPILEGGRGRRYYHLELNPDYMISFPALLTIRHTIDEDSPLYGYTTLEEMQASDCIFVASVSCVDTALPASVQGQHQYVASDVHFNHRFTKIFTEDKKHRIVIDYARIDEIEPFPTAKPEPSKTTPAKAEAASKESMEETPILSEETNPEETVQR